MRWLSFIVALSFAQASCASGVSPLESNARVTACFATHTCDKPYRVPLRGGGEVALPARVEHDPAVCAEQQSVLDVHAFKLPDGTCRIIFDSP